MSCLGYEFYLFNNYMLPSTINRRPKQEENQRKKPEKTMAERLYGSSNRPKRYF